MSIRRVLATARRVATQLRHDKRTVALIMFVPVMLVTLLKFVFADAEHIFNQIAPLLLGIFPLFIMFLVASIATLRERTSGTLDRLMTMPISKLDVVFGYAITFSIVGLIQASLVTAVTLWLLDVSVAGSFWLVLVNAAIAAFLGTALGLFVSAFARNEFQAVQLVMPIIMPQVILCGLFVPREKMADGLEFASSLLPLTYSVEAMQNVAQSAGISGELLMNIGAVFAFGLAALLLGTATIKRQETR